MQIYDHFESAYSWALCAFVLEVAFRSPFWCSVYQSKVWFACSHPEEVCLWRLLPSNFNDNAFVRNQAHNLILCLILQIISSVFSFQWRPIYPLSWQKLHRKAASAAAPVVVRKTTFALHWPGWKHCCIGGFSGEWVGLANWCNVSLAGLLAQGKFSRTLFQYNEWQRRGK